MVRRGRPSRGSKGKGAARGRGRGGAAEQPAAPVVPVPSVVATHVPDFFGSLSRGGGILPTQPTHREQLVDWLSRRSPASSHTASSSATQSTPLSEPMRPTTSEPRPGHSSWDPQWSHIPQAEESPLLFTEFGADQEFSLASVGGEGTLEVCGSIASSEEAVDLSDTPQKQERVRRESLHLLETDDDVTQLPLSPGPEEPTSEEREESIPDDPITDPDWRSHRQAADSSSDDVGQEPTVPSHGRRGSVVAPSRRRPSTSPARQDIDVACRPHSKVGRISSRWSPVWHYFKNVAGDRCKVICNICNVTISRGMNVKNLTTTSMLRHVRQKHPASWMQQQDTDLLPGGDNTASSAASRSADLSRVEAPGHSSDPTHASSIDTFPSPLSSLGDSRRGVQLTVRQSFERRQKFPKTNPIANAITDSIARLLAFEMLPFRLVETDSFHHLMAQSCPRYEVPSRHHFARVAVPALHDHLSSTLTCALRNAVTSKVHLTTDTWSSTCGQGRYISLTAHWLNIVAPSSERNPAKVIYLPIPRIAGPSPTVESESSLSATPASTSTVVPSGSASGASWKRCSTGVAKRQHAVLKLICLGDKSHTAEELWNGIQAEANRWFTSLNLQTGKAVSDNGRNLVAALGLGGVTHVPCMAHVLNLVVQRFLKYYPDLHDLLVKVRKFCTHFRKSPTDMSLLSRLQKRLNLPGHRLIVDVSTRWNSTFHMLERFCLQKRGIVEFSMERSRMASSQKWTPIQSDEWAILEDLCAVLKIFEEATKMVSGDDALISGTIPIVCLLSDCLKSMIDEGTVPLGEDDQHDASVPHHTSSGTLPSRPPFVVGEVEEDDHEDGDELTGSMVPMVRGWTEEEADFSLPGPLTGSLPSHLRCGSLTHMADFMMGCLLKDTRIVSILGDDEYWLASLLDPLYKSKLELLLPEHLRSSGISRLTQVLVDQLVAKFPSNNAVQIAGSLPSGGTGVGTSHTGGSAPRGRLSAVWENFVRPSARQRAVAVGSISRREMFERMVHSYMVDDTGVEDQTSKLPFQYWVSKLDTWHELAIHALEVLACPAASVLSERVFSAAGGIISNLRTRLSAENADRLTMLKMNKAWISHDFSPPAAES